MSKNLIIEFEKENQEVQFEKPITGISIDGKKLSDVHDLTQKVIVMTKTIKVLATTTTSLALMAVMAIAWLCNWLYSHEASIDQLLLTGNREYDDMAQHARNWNSHQRQRAWVHLKEFHGLDWDEGMQDWINHSTVKAKGKKSKRGNHNLVKK